MPWFRRRIWNPADIPSLYLENHTIEVDIGFLPGEQHREAFKVIFAKLLQDNTEVLGNAVLQNIRAKRPVHLPESQSLPRPLDSLNAEALAEALYCSRNERVILVLGGPCGRQHLAVEFDNPRFWLGPAA